MATNPAESQFEVVDPRWLLKALGLTIVTGAVLSYLSLCLIIYQGTWQFFLHPSATVDSTPRVPFQALRFDAAATGNPRLSAWWIPAENTSPRTILFLHDGSGSLSASVAKLDVLHAAGVNILAFDYRGFGQSDGPHPNEVSMTEDTAAALDYLINTRHLAPKSITPYGEGLGASLALHLANSQSLPAVIVDNPDANAFTRAISGKRSQLLPMRSLTREHFEVRAELTNPKVAKLLLANSPFPTAQDRTVANQSLFRSAADPKTAVTFGPVQPIPAYVQSIQRFLDEFVP